MPAPQGQGWTTSDAITTTSNQFCQYTGDYVLVFIYLRIDARQSCWMHVGQQCCEHGCMTISLALPTITPTALELEAWGWGPRGLSQSQSQSQQPGHHVALLPARHGTVRTIPLHAAGLFVRVCCSAALPASLATSGQATSINTNCMPLQYVCNADIVRGAFTRKFAGSTHDACSLHHCCLYNSRASSAVAKQHARRPGLTQTGTHQPQHGLVAK